MKVLFVNSNPERFIKDREPLGIMCLSATLKRAGHEAMLCSPRIRNVERVLQSFPAQIIAYSITTGDHNFYLMFNEAVKKKNRELFSVFGGPHATFMAGFIEDNDSVDAVCRGEGDHAFVEFVERFESAKDYHLTPNFYVRRDGKIYRNPIRNLIDDLDTLPFPDRELVYNPSRLARENKIKNFMTMRGCPYHCSYCFNASYNELYKGKGKTLRRRSVDNVLNEILDVTAKYPLELVYFRDDTFILFPDWVMDFCHQYKRRINIPIVCTARADLITEHIAAELKKANCVSIEMGIETGNNDISNRVLKRNMDRKQIIEGAHILHSYGIKVLSENMIGIPGSNLAHDLETYVLNRKCAVYYANSSMLQPYFGTDIYEYIKKLNLFNRNIQDSTPEGYLRGESLLKLKHRKQRERLNKVIAISVKLRLPTWLVKSLIYLPLKQVYALVHIVFKGYCGSKLYPFRKSFKEQIQIFFQLFEQHHFLGNMKVK